MFPLSSGWYSHTHTHNHYNFSRWSWKLTLNSYISIQLQFQHGPSQFPYCDHSCRCSHRSCFCCSCPGVSSLYYMTRFYDNLNLLLPLIVYRSGPTTSIQLNGPQTPSRASVTFTSTTYSNPKLHPPARSEPTNLKKLSLSELKDRNDESKAAFYTARAGVKAARSLRSHLNQPWEPPLDPKTTRILASSANDMLKGSQQIAKYHKQIGHEARGEIKRRAELKAAK